MSCRRYIPYKILAVYHGFGTTILPLKLDPVNGKPIQEAVTSILHVPAFLVSFSLRRMLHLPCMPLTLPLICQHLYQAHCFCTAFPFCVCWQAVLTAPCWSFVVCTDNVFECLPVLAPSSADGLCLYAGKCTTSSKANEQSLHSSREGSGCC